MVCKNDGDALLVGGTGATARAIQDKTFFIGELKQRMQTIVQETERLANENQRLEEEASNFMTLEKRSQAMTVELEDLQGQLGDYNLMFECLQKDRDLEELIQETARIKASNEEKQKNVEELFFQRQK